MAWSRKETFDRNKRILVMEGFNLPKDFIPHVIFPRQLPQREEPGRTKIETALLKCFVNFIQLPNQATYFPQATKTMLINWDKLQSQLEEDFSLNKSLISLNKGETVPVCIQKQNCNILFTKLDETKMRIITFRASFPNEEIMSTIGSLKVTYPETVNIVPISNILLSPAFSRHVQNLSLQTCPIAMVKNTKAGTEFVADRQVPNPFVVSEFLVGMLQPMSQTKYDDTLKCCTNIKFTKKVRDEVNWEKCDLPFRRSGVWMSLKVVLQLGLKEEIESQEDALLAYKLVLLSFITSVCRDFVKKEPNNWDMISQMLTKLARRATKLSEMPVSTEELWEESKASVLIHTFKTIGEIHKSLTESWKKVQFETSSCSEVKRIFFSERYINEQIKYDWKSVNDYLKQPRRPDNNFLTTVELQLVQVKRQNTLSQLLHSTLDSDVWIYDTENFIMNELKSTVTCKEVHNLLQAYTERAVKMYAEDPVGFSRMTLLVLKIIKIQDEIALEKHQLLKRYPSGIDPNMFDNLLLPHKNEMTLLDALVEYFRNRNKTAEANYLSLLQSDSVSESHFSVQFAERSPEMTELKNKILKDTEASIEKKYEEVRKVKAECNKLQVEVSPLKCDREWDKYSEKYKHYMQRCKRCLLNRELRMKRNSVDFYQQPLPTTPSLQNAVVFELLIPDEIAYLRDSICIFLAEIYGQTLFNDRTNSNMPVNWSTFIRKYEDNTRFLREFIVRLGSSVNSTVDSHCGKQTPDVVLASETEFIVNNGLDCKYFWRKKLLNFKRAENVLTFQLRNTADSSPYMNLQSSMKEMRMNENQILALQYACDVKLSLKEFVAFGSLRSGHRIQLRNLYMALSNQSISLDKEPVLPLIFQIIWEIGPQGIAGVREIYEDFYNTEFSLEFLELIESIVISNASNWSNPLLMMPLVVIVVRILELNEDINVKQYCTKILKRSRIILDSWWEKLENLASSPENGEEKANEVSKALLITSIASTFTFNVCFTPLFAYIISDSSDITFWMRTICRLNRQKDQVSKISKFLQQLIHEGKHRIAHNIHDHLHEKIAELHFQSLHDFSCSKWTAASKAVEYSWKRCDCNNPADHVYEGKYVTKTNSIGSNPCHIIHIDILKGAFLVDGHPPTHLPESISRDTLFSQFFLHSRFTVQRDSNSFTTVSNTKSNNDGKGYKGNNYQFFFSRRTDDHDTYSRAQRGYKNYLLANSQVNTKNELIVRELHENYTLELLPPYLFMGHLATHFVKGYTHWLHSETGQILFRRKSCDLKVSEKNEYVLCPAKDRFMEYAHQNDTSRRYIFSPRSDVFQIVVNNFSRLENKAYIDIILEEDASNCQSLIVYLRRLNLTFELRNDFLYSRNFPGYFICTDQYKCLGTLVGLRNGFLLEKESSPESQKLFLVQHGEIQITNQLSGQHQVVSIDASNLRKPPIFTFEVDQILKRLRAGNDKSAWLYLAALHAATSSPFPDQFTGLTGTEMAVWILQSGFVWSCSPYDSESFKTLQMIRSLSPKRKYFPDHLKEMQTISWPIQLQYNSYAAYDGYRIIVDYLVKSGNRLEGLFHKTRRPKTEESEKDDDLPPGILRMRSYYRHLHSYNKAAHLEGVFLEGLPSFQFSQKRQDSVKKATGLWMQIGKVRMNEQSCFTISKPASIYSLLMTQAVLSSSTSDKLSSESLNTWFGTDFRSNWFQLYGIALQLQMDSKLEHEFTFLLGALLYSEKTSLEQVVNLHNITVAIPSALPKPLRTSLSFSPMSHNYVTGDIAKILRSGTKDYPIKYYDYVYERSNLVSASSSGSDSSDLEAKYTAARDKYLADQTIEVGKLNLVERKIYASWPCEKIDKQVVEKLLPEDYFDLDRITNSINASFANWFLNYQLKLFVETIDLQLLSAWNNFPGKVAAVTVDSLELKQLHFETVRDEVFVQTSQNKEIDSMFKEIFISGELSNLKEGSSSIEGRQYCLQLIDKVTKSLEEFSWAKETAKASNKAGTCLRLVPVILLRNLHGLQASGVSKNEQENINSYTGALGVLFSHLKRFNRMLQYENESEIYSVELRREIDSMPFENWSPAEYPEWLLLELELNVTIRPIQVRVTKHMIAMSGGEKNGVTQLNMGEGKTSVIVPMIVSTLSKEENLLCRVTVLSSIFTTNFNLLSFSIGGLLKKRLYTVPCRRACKIFENLTKIRETYEESLKLKGVIMTLPEYRLSFRLMMYNYYLQKYNESAYQVYKIENWLRQHVRDIVDESDEIFSVKYQLIYTTGQQLPIDGGNLRWVVCQKLLQIIPPIALQLFKIFGSTVIEFHQEDAKANPEQFTHFRILSSECKAVFYDLMADAVLEGKTDLLGVIMNNDDNKLVKAFLIDEGITKEDHNAVINMKCITEEKKQILLLISGYLRRGVLLTALNKRWRVQCGVNDKGEKMMAVPFRAKDVAAEKTEFGHPDVAIVLTQLSYYYSGLSDEQLMETFTLLKNVVGPEKLYNAWIKRIPAQKNIHHSIQRYKGINLLDCEQRTNHLFPVLRKHKAAIDFWLENVVFPKEAKQFPGKLVMNAWDLCYENSVHPTTGFSGTNDSSLLLPHTITQQDLQELRKTNEDLERTLQKTENQWKRSFEMGVTCKTIMESMKEDGLRVLIDAGAMVLELGNEALAKLWLDVDTSLEGIVYFTAGNELVIKTRSSSQGTGRNSDTPLKLSSYRDRLSNCAVYLDDYHTRGTDLKLPADFKACVTIGSKMRRDKLMQACMRMRKLGNGQSVQFYLSHEADIKIRNLRNGNDEALLTVQDIVEWVKQNSNEFEEEGLVYWAANGRNYTQKLAADVYFDRSMKHNACGEILAKQCEDPEVFSIQALYGQYKKKELIVDVIPYWFSSVEQNLITNAGVTELTSEIRDIIERYKTIVLMKCKSRIPYKSLLYSMLDEEQEKELEPEQEEEAQLQRPPREQALAPQLNTNVRHLVQMGGDPSKYCGMMRLPYMFQNTTCWKLMQVEGWGRNLYVTEDFVKVIRTNGLSMQDSFLRPITYIVSWLSEENNPCLLVLSPFEVNELMPFFQSDNAKVTLHMFAGRYMEDQDILVNKSRLQLPISRRGTQQLDEQIMAPILIAAGNLFYENMNEQKAFAAFLGLCLRPWMKNEEEIFKEGMITSTGFVLPNQPKAAPLRVRSLFHMEPTGMIRAILKCKNEVLRDTDHVVRILDQCGFIEMDENVVDMESAD